MLNRRILRIKAMQALYGYHVATESLIAVVRDQLKQRFTPDPAIHDFSNTESFDINRKEALALYDKGLSGDELASENKEALDAAEEAVNQYHQLVRDEAGKIRRRMVEEVNQLEKIYYRFLMLPVEFQHLEVRNKEKQEQALVKKKSDWHHHFITNPVITGLGDHTVLRKRAQDLNLGWSEEFPMLKSWYKEILRENEELIAYQKLEEPTYQDHLKIVEFLFKKILYKEERMLDYWFSLDPGWTEDGPVIKSLIVKTIQQYEDGNDEEIPLKKVILNEEEDMEFFVDLYNETVKRSEELDELISKRTKNWELSRVALTDRIILKMALAEMMTCASIPIKVSINEYIEMSKTYSTPKSKQFVNGILDVLANELTSEGLIRKSGRGLIDNK